MEKGIKLNFEWVLMRTKIQQIKTGFMSVILDVIEAWVKHLRQKHIKD